MANDPFDDFNLDKTLRNDEWPLARFLAYYLLGFVEGWLSPWDLLLLLKYSLQHLPLRLFWEPTAGAELLCYAFDLILKTAQERQKKCLLSWGDTEHRRFSQKRDLIQKPVRFEDLPPSPSALCERLLQEALVVIHLLRGARFYAHIHSPLWQLYHQHAGIALSRLYTVWLRLRKETTPWIAYLCLRWALGEAWQVLFGPKAPLPEKLDEQDMPLWAEVETFEVLSQLTRKVPHARVPKPLLKVVWEWTHGNPPPPRPPVGEDWPEAFTVRFKV
jgi:hypothetical protein